MAQTWHQLVPPPAFLLGLWSPSVLTIKAELRREPVAGGRDFQAGLRFRIKSGPEKGSGGRGRGGLAAGLIPAANLLLLPSSVTGLDIPQPPKSLSYPSPSPRGKHSLHFMDEEIETQSPSYLFLVHRKCCRRERGQPGHLPPRHLCRLQGAGPQRPRRPPALSEPCSALSAGSLCFSELSWTGAASGGGAPNLHPQAFARQARRLLLAPHYFHFHPPFKTSHSCSSMPRAAGAPAPRCKCLSEVTFQPQLILQGLIHGGPLFQEVREAAPFLWTPISLLVLSSNIRGEGKDAHADCLPLVCLAHFNFHNSSGVGLDFPFFQMRKPRLR